ncbi:MAG: DUF4136 domain-containing protein [Bacteroidota bacterium]
MKNILLFVICAVIFSGCLGFKELPVEYDYSYYGKFKRYKTFNLMSQPVLSSDSSMENSIIESAIVSRMRFLGYRQTTKKPNLLIAYKIYYDSLNFNGYNQPDIEDWVKNPTINEDYEEKDVSMKTGTLLVQLYDRKQNKLIWNGYATSLYGDIHFENKRQIRNAVISILDKYRFFADGFIQQGQVVEDAQ